MKKRRAVIQIAIAAIVVVSLFGIFAEHRQRNNSHTWYRSLTNGGNLDLSYLESEFKTVSPSSDFKITLTPSGDTRFKVNEQGQSGEIFPKVAVQYAGESSKHTHRFAGGSIELISLGVSVLNSKSATILKQGAPPKFAFFDSDGISVIAQPDLPNRLLYADHSRESSELPTSGDSLFHFVQKGIDRELQLSEISFVYDTKTGTNIGFNHVALGSDPEAKSSIFVEGEYLQKFHPGPIEVSLCVAQKPREIMITAETGCSFSLGPLKGELALMAPGEWYSDNDEVERDSADGYTVGILLDHTIWTNALAVNAIDEDGVETELIAPGWKEDLRRPIQELWFSGTTNTKPVELRVRYWEEFCHLLFSAHFPSLSELNTDIANIFDVEIPLITIDGSFDFGVQLCDLAHMRFKNGYLPPTTFTENYFPKTFTDITVRELLDEYRRYTPDQRFWIDSNEPYIIQYPDPERESMKDRFKNWWGQFN